MTELDELCHLQKYQTDPLLPHQMRGNDILLGNLKKRKRWLFCGIAEAHSSLPETSEFWHLEVATLSIYNSKNRKSKFSCMQE